MGKTATVMCLTSMQQTSQTGKIRSLFFQTNSKSKNIPPNNKFNLKSTNPHSNHSPRTSPLPKVIHSTSLCHTTWARLSSMEQANSLPHQMCRKTSISATLLLNTNHRFRNHLSHLRQPVISLKKSTSNSKTPVICIPRDHH